MVYSKTKLEVEECSKVSSQDWKASQTFHQTEKNFTHSSTTLTMKKIMWENRLCHPAMCYLKKSWLINNWLSQHWHSYMLHLIFGELGIWFGVFGNLLQYSNLVQQRSSKRKTGGMQLAKTISVLARLWRKMWNVFVGIADYNQYLGMKIVPVFWESMSVEEDCILLARVLTRRETLTLEKPPLVAVWICIIGPGSEPLPLQNSA